MSDFDREAERERLREQYERDQEKRAATERMSDLLLKGATMTDAHCEHCGDPIFRYEGEEFCPTCQQLVGSGDETSEPEVDERDGETSEATGRATEDEDEDDAAERTPADAQDASGAGGDSAEDRHPAGDDQAVGSPGTVRTKRPTGPRADAPGDPSGAPPASGSSGELRRPDAGGESPPVPDNELGEARASLRQALTFHARQAAETADPRRATDHLTAAREAAEALSALK